ncbi:MAG: SDR family oxidoreductase [Actinomycetota bacterium]|nr:SDR family oxidoreductase [Actinomycetota bacterium]
MVITGSSGGIGRAASAALERGGARVTGIDALPSEGCLQADVRDPAALVRAITTAAEQMGGIDVLINNAGIGRAHDAGDFPDDEARAVMDVNFFGAWNATAAALPHLLDTRGHVVNVASGLAIVDLPYAAAYSASKRALVAYSAALRVEYRGRITVTTVYPGYLRTAIHDAPLASGVSLEGLIRADRLEDAASAVVRACVRRPESLSTGNLSTLELWAARRFPQATRRVIGRRFTGWRKRRDAPGFLRYPESGAWHPHGERET